jgi:hypothetical protein
LLAALWFSRKALEHFLGEAVLLQPLVDLVEDRHDIASGSQKSLALCRSKLLPDVEQLGREAAPFWCKRNHPPAGVALIAHGASDSRRDHLVGYADDAGVSQAQAGGDLADCERWRRVQKLECRSPPGTEFEVPRVVYVLGRAEQGFRDAAKPVVEDDGAELADIIHESDLVELRNQLRKL